MFAIDNVTSIVIKVSDLLPGLVCMARLALIGVSYLSGSELSKLMEILVAAEALRAKAGKSKVLEFGARRLLLMALDAVEFGMFARNLISCDRVVKRFNLPLLLRVALGACPTLKLL